MRLVTFKEGNLLGAVQVSSPFPRNGLLLAEECGTVEPLPPPYVKKGNYFFRRVLMALVLYMEAEASLIEWIRRSVASNVSEQSTATQWFSTKGIWVRNDGKAVDCRAVGDTQRDHQNNADIS